MISQDSPPITEDSQVEAMLALDQWLASGADPFASEVPASLQHSVHECQRLLEAVWPRGVPPSSNLPRRFGRFSIQHELGRGGFGIVFLAVDSVLRRKVALKVPRPEVLITEDLRRRFRREAEAASRLDHPHIVPVYEVGEEGAVSYIASAYCEGPTLADWLRGQTAPVPYHKAARLVAILGAAVAHAHQREILHRDLKPGNVLLQRCETSVAGCDGACEFLGYVPRICDFGLAKLLDQVSQETCSGVPIGSASYMAPEQASGRLREQGPATDVYALGVILYELLTARPPFRGETDLETLRLVSDQDPPSPRALRPGLPRDLETIALKCLEKRPGRRFASALALTEDLHRFLDGKPVHARPVPAWERTRKWARRRPVHAALGILLALALSSVLGVLLWKDALLHRHNQDLREAVARAERDMQQAERSTQEARIGIARVEEREQFSHRYGLATQVRLLHETFVSRDAALAASMFDVFRPVPGQPEPSGFAWGYLRQLFQPEVTLLDEAHSWGYEPVLQLAISPDGRTLAGGFANGRVVLWDLIEQRLLRSLDHRDSETWDQVYFVAFSPDGRWLASGSPTRNTVKIWEVATGRLQAALPTLPNPVISEFRQLFALRFTDTSDSIGIFGKGYSDGSFHVLFWSVPAPGAQPELKASLNAKQLASFDRNGSLKEPAWPRADEAAAPWLTYARNHLFLLDDEASLAIVDGASGAEIFEPSYYSSVARIRGPLNIPVLQERGFAGLTQDEVRQFSRQARRLVGTVDKENPRSLGPYALARYAPDGRSVAHFREGLGVVLTDVASGRTLTTYAPKTRWRVVDLAYTPDGRFLVMAGFHPRIHLWRLRPSTLAGHRKEVWGLAFSPDGTSLASAADDHFLKLWDVQTGRECATLQGHESLVTAVAYSPDGALLASAGFDRTIRLWNASTGAALVTLRGHADRVRALAFSPDGKTLASAGNDREVRLWDVAARSELSPPLTGHTEGVFSLAFAPDGKTLYSGSLDKTIRLWDWGSGRVRAVWRAEDQVYSLAIAPDGQTLAVGHHDGKVTLWDVARQTARPALPGHVGDVLGLAFSPDGLTLASAGRDRTVRLWDPVTAQELIALKGHDAPVHALAFSPEGAILATGSHDGAIRFGRASHDRSNPGARSETHHLP